MQYKYENDEALITIEPNIYRWDEFKVMLYSNEENIEVYIMLPTAELKRLKIELDKAFKGVE